MCLESDGQFLIIDAGSGLLMLEKELRAAYVDYPNNVPGPFHILLSHLHIDHIIGLTTFSPIWQKEPEVYVYTASRDERPLKEQVFGVFKPPYWPVVMKDSVMVKCILTQADIPFTVGPFTVTPFAANHPDETYSFHITDGRVNVVHLLDSEVSTGPEAEALSRYCREADLIVFDAAYAPEDYLKHKGWGHSTVTEGVRLAREWNCRTMQFAHFSQDYDDAALEGWRRYFDGDDRFILAYDGMEIEL